MSLGARVLLAAAALVAACGEETGTERHPESAPPDDAPCEATDLPYASELVSFAPGAGAGYGQDELPGVVLGPPAAVDEDHGSLDVLSLGVGGEIVVGFGTRDLVDGDGADVVIFENAFFIGGDTSRVFAEAGEVSASEDGVTWHTWTCELGADASASSACAGRTPTRAYPRCTASSLVDVATGGDAFDLAALGLTRARYVRVKDLAETGAAPSAGFDLDAVGAVHWGER